MRTTSLSSTASRSSVAGAWTRRVTSTKPSHADASRRMSVPSIASSTPCRSSSADSLSASVLKTLKAPSTDFRNSLTCASPGVPTPIVPDASSGAPGHGTVLSRARSCRSSSPLISSSCASLHSASCVSVPFLGHVTRSSSMFARNTAPCCLSHVSSSVSSLGSSSSTTPLRLLSTRRSTMGFDGLAPASGALPASPAEPPACGVGVVSLDESSPPQPAATSQARPRTIAILEVRGWCFMRGIRDYEGRCIVRVGGDAVKRDAGAGSFSRAESGMQRRPSGRRSERGGPAGSGARRAIERGGGWARGGVILDFGAGPLEAPVGRA